MSIHRVDSLSSLKIENSMFTNFIADALYRHKHCGIYMFIVIDELVQTLLLHLIAAAARSLRYGFAFLLHV